MTVNIGTITGGVSPNLVPTNARAQCDVRLPVGTTTAALLEKLDEALRPLDGVTWRPTPKLRAELHRSSA